MFIKNNQSFFLSDLNLTGYKKQDMCQAGDVEMILDWGFKIEIKGYASTDFLYSGSYKDQN